ncbi:MAG TPA: ROK family protein [Bryobacteraceae bacterium]|nr:ROK family protein [Bryobacteraceae bacterium]
MDYVIGCDVGGTRLKYVAVTKSGRVVKKNITLSGADRGPEYLVNSLATTVDDAEAALGARAKALAFGISGAVNPQKGVVLLPGKFANLEGYPLVPKLRKRTRIPVVAENDGRISIIAEKHYGAARKRKWVVCLTIGTGLGSGVMLDGQILRDPFLQFGTQIGHIVLQADGGRLCMTGARGTAETLCAATALAMQVRDGLQRGVPSRLTEQYLENPHSIDFAAAIRGVDQGDPLCIDELKRWTEHLGWLVLSAVHAFAPELVILSGGATSAANHFLPAVREQVNRHVFRYPKGKPVPIVVSRMGEFAGAMGAAALAWEAARRVD